MSKINSPSGKKFKKSLSFKAPDVKEDIELHHDEKHHQEFEERRKEMLHREQELNKMLFNPEVIQELEEQEEK